MAQKTYKQEIEFDYKINTKNAEERIRYLQALMKKTQKGSSDRSAFVKEIDKEKSALKRLNTEYRIYERAFDKIKSSQRIQREKQDLFASGFVKPSQKLRMSLENANIALSSQRHSLLDDAAAAAAKGDIKTAKAKTEQANKLAKEQKVMNVAFQAAGKAAKAVKNAFNKLVTGIKDVVTSMLNLQKGVATYSTSTSLITNASARETQLKYGLSDSQAYAFDKARSLLNIQSDEDLMYMNSAQREKLLAYMEKYSAWYDKMENSGVLENVQEMQLELQEFKEEIAMEFLQWVSENKEVIIGALKGIFNFVKALAEIVLAIVNILSFGKYKQSTTTSDTLASSSTSNTKNTNVTINANTTNNANGVGDAAGTLNQINSNQWSNLAKQLVTAIE